MFALLGGLEVPGHSLVMVLLDALTLCIRDPRVRLGCRVPLPRGFESQLKSRLGSCATPLPSR